MSWPGLTLSHGKRIENQNRKCNETTCLCASILKVCVLVKGFEGFSASRASRTMFRSHIVMYKQIPRLYHTPQSPKTRHSGNYCSFLLIIPGIIVNFWPPERSDLSTSEHSVVQEHNPKTALCFFDLSHRCGRTIYHEIDKYARHNRIEIRLMYAWSTDLCSWKVEA